tara:strand:- start:3587 stop:4717 length:1131 start_codon:yes stop_codon:yes gene_type:complete
MDYIELLELHLSPTENNKRFKTLNEDKQNLVINLGLKMLDKGMKEVQLWKNDEWEDKINTLKNNKNKIIENLNEEVEFKKTQFETFIKDQRVSNTIIKKQVEEQVKSIYEIKIKDLYDKLNESTKLLDEEMKSRWDMQSLWHDKLNIKIESIRNEEEEKRTSLRKEYNELLEKERSKYMDICKRQENSTLLGQDGESFTYHNLNRLFPKAEVIDTHDIKQSGDFKLVYNNIPLLLEVKNYSGNVLKKEIVKFQRDIEYQTTMKGGIFISLKSGISARSDFQLEVYDGRPVIFLTYVKDNMDKIKLAVKFIETMVKENIDLNNEEIVGGLKKLIPMIKRKWNTLKGTLENFKNKMSRELLEQESNIVDIFKIIGMKY